MDEQSPTQAQLTPQEQFFRYFQHQITALQEQMERLTDKALIGGERKDATDHCLASITRLATEVKDASSSLPPYDVRTYSEAVKALQDKLAETQAAFAPKAKFSFKTKKNASAISIQDAAELAAQRRGISSNLGSAAQSTASSFSTTPIHLITPPNERNLTTTNQDDANQRSMPKQSTSQDNLSSDENERQHRFSTSKAQGLTRSPTSTTIMSLTNSHIVLPSSATHAQTPCQLSKLSRCCIDLSIPTTETAPFASLTITNISSSLLLCGSVDGPAHITNVNNSTILVSCRQFRMHECTNVTIYLHCTSRPIIEDCTNIKFTQLPAFFYELLHPQGPLTKPAGENLWDQIDDFKWLRAEPSPNWTVLAPSERVSDSIWRDIIPGKPGRSVNEVLTAANVPTL